MAGPRARAVATANPADEYTRPRDAHAPDFPAEIPTFAPTDPPRNESEQSRTYIQLHPAPESPPASASSPRDQAAEYSIPPPSFAALARRARRPQVLPIGTMLKSSRSAAGSAQHYWQNVRIVDRQTTAASSSSRPHAPSPPPTASSVHTSPATWEQLRPACGNSGSDPAKSAARLYKRLE